MAFLGLLESDFLLFFRWKDVRLHHSELEKETDSGKQGQDRSMVSWIHSWETCECRGLTVLCLSAMCFLILCPVNLYVSFVLDSRAARPDSFH